jgi:hypothetical protein
MVLQEGAITMARTTLDPTAQPITAAELLEQGFTPVEIRNLTTLREEWNPAAEQTESMLDWRRIQFAKWLYEHGHYSEEVAA